MIAKRLLLLCVLLQPAASALAALVGEPLMRLEGGLRQPSAVAVAADGTAFVLDGLRRRVLVFDAAGALVDELTLPQGKTPATDIAIAAGRLYVADPGGHRILVLDRWGKLLAQRHPRPDEAPAEPSAVLVENNRLWWSDRRGHRLCRGRLDRDTPPRCGGKRGERDGEFHFPYMLAADAGGYVLAVDVLNARVQIFAPDGQYYGGMGSFGLRPGQLFRPNGVLGLADGGVLVSDAWTGRITLFRQRKARTLLWRPDGRPWKFAMPVGMARWRDRLYVVDLLADRVEVLRLVSSGDAAPLAESGVSGRDSRRNCLQCHPSWSPDFSPDEHAGVLPVADERMCLSCHHGAVVESRPRLGRGHQHPTLHQRREGKPAGDSGRFEQDQVPREYPLGRDGHLYCGSCHSPHDRPEGGRALGAGRNNAWLRQANRNSSLCLDCHASRNTPARDRDSNSIHRLNHPLGVKMARPPREGVEGYAVREELQQGLPDELKQAGARLGEQGELICQSCHGVHGAAAAPLLVKDAQDNGLCAACHRSQHAGSEDEARRKGVHPVGLKLDEEVELGGRKIRRVDCLACHSVHEAQPGTALLPRGENRHRLCRSCHDRQWAKDRDQARTRGVHPVNVKLDEPVKLAGQELRELDCRGCHTVHGGVKGTPALVEDHTEGSLCRACHGEQEAVLGTDHDLRNHPASHRNRLKQSWRDAGLCGACHSLHRSGGKQPFLFVGPEFEADEPGDILPRDALCMGCHQRNNQVDAKPVEHFSHPWKDLILRSDPEDMPLLDEQGRVAEFGRIACVTCHEPHHWRPGEKAPNDEPSDVSGAKEGTALTSFLRRKGILGSFCVHCHGRETNFRYKYYHDGSAKSDDNRTPLLY